MLYLGFTVFSGSKWVKDDDEKEHYHLAPSLKVEILFF